MSRVLILPDCHAPCMHKDAVTFLEDISAAWECDTFVHIGDLVDWSSISYHPKAVSLRNSELEYENALEQVANLYKSFPKVDWLIGNHDALSERQADDAALPRGIFLDYATMWQVPNWTVHPRFADLTIDGVIYRHGDKGAGGSMPAYTNSQKEFCSVVQGHFHASAGVVWGANSTMRYFGMQVGCVTDYRKAAMAYGKKYSKKPVLGCGVVIDGTPYFEPMNLGSRKGILNLPNKGIK